MGGSGPLPPSPEELALAQQQANLTQAQYEALQYQMEQARLLGPIILEQMGITPIYATRKKTRTVKAGSGYVFVKNPDTGKYEKIDSATYYTQVQLNQRPEGAVEQYDEEYDETYVERYEVQNQEERKREREQELAINAAQQELLLLTLQQQKDLAPAQKEAIELQLKVLKQQAAQALEAQRLQDLLTPQLLTQQGWEVTLDADGKITGIAPGEEMKKRQKIEAAQAERSLAALEGRLEVNPALIADLDKAEGTLKETLRRQLGSDYATSTPGIEALAEFSKNKTQILEGARRGDLTLAEQLNINRQTARQSGTGELFGTLQGVYPYGAEGPGALFSPTPQRQQRAGISLADALGQFAGPQADFAQVFSGFGSLRQQLAGDRQAREAYQQQQRQQRQAQFAAAGTLLGTLGAVAAPATWGLSIPAAAAAGAAAGTGLSYL